MNIKKTIITASLLIGLVFAFSILTDDDGRYRSYRTYDIPFEYKVNSTAEPEWIPVIREGAYSWNKVKGAYFEFADSGFTSITTLGEDGINLVYFDKSDSGNFEPGTNTIAFSSTFTSGYSTPNYKAVESDLIYNARDYPPGMNGEADQQDLQSIIVHEFGHHLGLGHAGDAGSPPGVGDLIRDATMYGYSSNGDTTARSLYIDDIMGVISIYPRWTLNASVMDSLDSLPVQNATYYLNGKPMAALSSILLHGGRYQRAGYVKTDTLLANPETGFFSFISPNNEITLTLDAYGYQPLDTTIYLGDSSAVNEKTDISFYLSRTPKYQVTFKIYDAGTQEDVAAKVMLKAKTDFINQITFQDTTDSAGVLSTVLSIDSYDIYINPDLPYAFTELLDYQIHSDTTINIGLYKADILLIDDDYSAGIADRDDGEDFYITQILEHESLERYAYKETDLDSLSSEGMMEIPIVIWAAGDNDKPVLDRKTELLQSFMDNGGKVIVTGNRLLASLSDTVFVRDYLHASFGGISPTQLLRGEAGDPIGNGQFLGQSAASTEMMIKDSDPKTSDVFKFLGQTSAGVIKYESSYKLVLFSFGMNHILENSSYVSPGDVFKRSIDWLNTPTGISAAEAIIPAKTELYQNYPNPFNPATTIAFDLNKKQNVELFIYNSLGQKVRSFDLADLSAGSHKISWDGKNNFKKSVSSGLYYFLLKTKDFSKVRKMLLIR